MIFSQSVDQSWKKKFAFVSVCVGVSEGKKHTVWLGFYETRTYFTGVRWVQEFRIPGSTICHQEPAGMWDS